MSLHKAMSSTRADLSVSTAVAPRGLPTVGWGREGNSNDSRCLRADSEDHSFHPALRGPQEPQAQARPPARGCPGVLRKVTFELDLEAGTNFLARAEQGKLVPWSGQVQARSAPSVCGGGPAAFLEKAVPRSV